ncbi:SoxR reducing system RseC family protein [Marinobacter sp.]|uniref:SoxR reducing system RseC family protein n=1 Tax=Marinobacter sp. TaxID=50741 RepID=UPI0034A289F4
MITESGKVVAIEGHRAWVQTIRNSACQSCSARHGCGQKVLASASGGKANQVLVSNGLSAVVGDEVILAIDEAALLRASMLVYAVPLVLMVVGAVIGHQWSGGYDLAAMAGAAAGLGSGFLVARRQQRKSAGDYEPRMVRFATAAVVDVRTNSTVV